MLGIVQRRQLQPEKGVEVLREEGQLSVEMEKKLLMVVHMPEVVAEVLEGVQVMVEATMRNLEVRVT